MVEILFSLPKTVRVKLNSDCQYKCKFCHQEGGIQTKNVDVKEVIAALAFFRKKLNFTKVHFTGGEPTLYKNLPHLLALAKKKNFTTALTTNGQFEAKTLRHLKNRGLDSINFSLHTMNYRAFLNIQNASIKTEINWAKYCLNRAIQNILIANKLFKTKINCVVGLDAKSPQEILKFCLKNNVQLRFLNDLTAGKIARDNIQMILKKSKAKLIQHDIDFLSSSHRLHYQIEKNFRLIIKEIRPLFLNSICNNCELKETNKCLEKFYGIRVESNPLMVRLCLSKQHYPYVQKINAFAKSRQLKEIKQALICFKKYSQN